MFDYQIGWLNQIDPNFRSRRLRLSTRRGKKVWNSFASALRDEAVSVEIYCLGKCMKSYDYITHRIHVWYIC
jgi:hypothetical protein